MSATLRQKLARHAVTRAILHPWITLISLIILFLLVFFGTLHQADHGLYEAQRLYFDYGLVLVGGIFPLPGASLVLWVLSIQLIITMLVTLPLKWKKLGLWISHGGILVLLIGGFITQMMSVESQLTLAEGEIGHYSTSYHDWELAFWERKGDTNQVYAIVDDQLKAGREIKIASHGFDVEVKAYYRNSTAFTEKATGGKLPYVNPSGIATLESKAPEKEVTQNAPGIFFTLKLPGKKPMEVLLFGGESQPLIFTTAEGKTLHAQLRLRHYPLPFAVYLDKFTRVLHPGTDMAASYESEVQVTDSHGTRPIRIYMNNPMRYEGYTFFQASFSQERMGLERSTFAVVTNPGRLLPYISSLTVFGGLLLHFLIVFAGFIRRERQA